MEDEDLDFESVPKSRSAKLGRRARGGAAAASVAEENKVEDEAPTPSRKDGPPPDRPAKAVSGWGEDAPRKPRTRQLGEGFEQFEDERLRPRSPDRDSGDSDQDIPVIPELEDQQEEDMTTKVAVAPNITVNRVATYRELDNDLLRQAAFLTLDNDIDLKLLTKSISPEHDLIEEDAPWDWDRLFTEVTSDLMTDLEKDEKTESEPITDTI